MTQLADLKADMNRVLRVLAVIEDQASELWGETTPERRTYQIDSLQSTIAVLIPFAKTLDKNLERFPDGLEVKDERART
jgi:hypothetical protein